MTKTFLSSTFRDGLDAPHISPRPPAPEEITAHHRYGRVSIIHSHNTRSSSDILTTQFSSENRLVARSFCICRVSCDRVGRLFLSFFKGLDSLPDLLQRDIVVFGEAYLPGHLTRREQLLQCSLILTRSLAARLVIHLSTPAPE